MRHNVQMPMRQDCKFFESRSYPNGDTVRKCDLDLAPEAPWRCPTDCPRFTRRLADVNWSHGSLVTPETPAEPESVGSDDSVAALLDAAEDIINAAVPDAIADLDRERKSRRGLRGIARRNKSSNSSKNGRSSRARAPREGLADKLRRRYRGGR